MTNLGEERYSGTYDIIRRVEMGLVYDIDTNETDWLSCCVAGCSDLDPCDYPAGEVGVFDCVCG